MKTSTVAIITAAAVLSMSGLNTLNLRGAERLASERQGRGQMLARIREKLDLTDDQVSQIKAELGAERDTLKNLISRLA